MMKAFEGVYLIHVDVDDWNWNSMKKYGFDFDGIPTFFKLNSEGKPTGAVLDGSAWDANTPSNMAPVLDKFFHNP